MKYEAIEKLCKKLCGNNPFAIGAALAGGVGMLNVLDSLIIEHTGVPWTLIPDWLRPFFILIRDLWRPLIDHVVRYFPFKVSDPAKDYMLMGAIVAGMRFRSSMVIWKALKDQTLGSYTQRTVLPGHPLELRHGEHLKFCALFLPIRLSFAFVAWPLKIFGAIWRYRSGEWGEDFDKGSARMAREEQYLTFFRAVIWAGILVFLCLLVR